jgi:hypothetical protein
VLHEMIHQALYERNAPNPGKHGASLCKRRLGSSNSSTFGLPQRRTPTVGQTLPLSWPAIRSRRSHKSYSDAVQNAPRLEHFQDDGNILLGEGSWRIRLV